MPQKTGSFIRCSIVALSCRWRRKLWVTRWTAMSRNWHVHLLPTTIYIAESDDRFRRTPIGSVREITLGSKILFKIIIGFVVCRFPSTGFVVSLGVVRCCTVRTVNELCLHTFLKSNIVGVSETNCYWKIFIFKTSSAKFSIDRFYNWQSFVALSS